MTKTQRIAMVLAGLLLAGTGRMAHAQLKAGAGDWPGWRGPDRTSFSTETGLLTRWPSGGPKLLWKMQGLGDGFSTPSVAAGRIYLMGTKGQSEHVFALDSRAGKVLWSTAVGTMTGGHPGPRSTPTIDETALYVISSDGKLACLDSADGQLRWSKDFKADFGGKCGTWAYAESPLIDGDVLVCTPGGDTATLVALNKQTGAVLRKAPVTGLESSGKRSYATAAYSSVIAAHIAGTRQYIQFLSGGVVGIEAATGKLLWHYDHPANKTANISTPICKDDSVFAASAYGTGGGLVRISSAGGKYRTEEAYFLQSMQNHHGGMILLGDYLYGTNGNSLLCVHFSTGKIAWENRSVGKGALAYADGRLYLRSENGPVALVDANPKAYTESGRFDQPERSKKKAWAHPVVTGGRLYLRDQDILLCYDVRSE
jgi:outer membrane protein assembly factor BamB